MKKWIAFICLALPVAGLNATTQPGEFSTLPLGSEAAIIAQLKREVVGFNISIYVWRNGSEPGQRVGYAYVGGAYPYDQSSGDLSTVVSNTMLYSVTQITNGPPGFQVNVDIGYTLSARPKSSIEYPAPTVIGYRFIWSFPTTFDSNGKVVLPNLDHLYDFPMADYIPVSDALTGVQSVEFVYRKNGIEYNRVSYCRPSKHWLRKAHSGFRGVPAVPGDSLTHRIGRSAQRIGTHR